MSGFDLILRPFDNFWHRRYRTAAQQLSSAEASARCAEGLRSLAEEERLRLSDISVKQAQAIHALQREADSLTTELSKAREQLEAREWEIGVLKEALRSERTALAAMKTNARLWEEKKTAVVREHRDAGEVTGACT